MKYIFVLLPLFLSGCESLNFYTNKVFTEEPKNYYRTETINNWQIFGIIKFHVSSKVISSRINWIFDQGKNNIIFIDASGRKIFRIISTKNSFGIHSELEGVDEATLKVLERNKEINFLIKNFPRIINKDYGQLIDFKLDASNNLIFAKNKNFEVHYKEYKNYDDYSFSNNIFIKYKKVKLQLITKKFKKK